MLLNPRWRHRCFHVCFCVCLCLCFYKLVGLDYLILKYFFIIGHKTLKTTELASCKQQHKLRPTQTCRSGCTNNMRLPVYLLLAFVLSSLSMGFLGSGDGLFASSSRITLPNSGTLLFSDAAGFTSALSGCFTEPLRKYKLLSLGTFSPSAAGATGELALPSRQDQQAFGLSFSCSYQVTSILTQAQN